VKRGIVLWALDGYSYKLAAGGLLSNTSLVALVKLVQLLPATTHLKMLQ